MLNRFDGNVVPFASEATLTNRTVFGAETQSDDIDDNLNADFKKGWEIVGLNDNPTREDFNAMGYTLGNLISYLYQNGVAEWNDKQEYKINSIAIGTDGNIYQSLVDSNIGNALTDTTKWVCIASKNSIVNSIAELKTISNIESINVLGYYSKGDGGGGLFYWDSTSTETDDGGYTIQATGITTGRWKRAIKDKINILEYGAKCDWNGITGNDDTSAIQKAIDSDIYEVVFPANKKVFATSIDLSNRTKELLINLNGSTLTQGLQYARLSANGTIVRTSGQTATFQVEDSSKIKVGTQVRSSYGLGDTEGTGGAYVISKTPTSITVQYGANHLTYDGATITIYNGAYIGNFIWSGFLGANNVKVSVKNGTISESTGYWYANANAELYSENVKFDKRGLDGFSGNRPDCLYSFKDCIFGNSLDVAKQTFYMINGSSLRFEKTRFASSNYDSEIHFAGNESAYLGSKHNLYINNCNFDGLNTTIRHSGAEHSTNNLHAILLQCDKEELKMGDIEIYAGKFANYERGLIGTTVNNETKNITIDKLVINGVRSDIPFGIFRVNNIVLNVALVSISDSDFFMSNTDYSTKPFTQFEINNSNGSVFTALWNNCTFRFQNGANESAGGVFTNSHLDSCVFDSCKLKTNDLSKVSFDNLIMRGSSSGIQITPSYDNDFNGGCDGLIILDNTNFPLNFSSIFGSAADRYGQLCKMTSIRGGAVYDVGIWDSSIVLSGTFKVAPYGITSGSFKGDDWYVPVQSSITAGSKILGVTEMCFPVTSSANYTAGTTSIITSGYAGYPGYRPAAGHYINLVLDDGEVFTTTVASIGANGNYINLTDAIPSAMSSGNNICSFKLLLTTYS